MATDPRYARARDAAERHALQAFVFDPDPDPDTLPEYRERRSIGTDAESFAKIVDRAAEICEQMIGRPPDRRRVAESTAGWLRVLR